MRKVLLALWVLFTGAAAFAQHSFNVGVSLGDLVSYPLRHDPLVSGISMEYTRQIFSQTDVRFSAGLEITDPRMSPDDGSLVNWYYGEYRVAAIRTGLQRFVYSNKVLLYIEPGVTIGSFPYATVWSREAEKELAGTKVNLSYAAGAGYRLPLKKRSFLQGSLSFNRNPYRGEMSFSWINLRVAYGWKSRPAK